MRWPISFFIREGPLRVDLSRPIVGTRTAGIAAKPSGFPEQHNVSSPARLCENSCVQFARRKFFSFGQSQNQKFWRRLFEEGNRENCSTLSWLAHVFTRPGPIAAIA